MDLDAIRQAMDHLEAAHLLLEPYHRGQHAPFHAIPGLAWEADGSVLYAFNILGGVLEYEEPRRAAVYAAEAVLGGAEGA
jgi:hypothetical protein